MALDGGIDRHSDAETEIGHFCAQGARAGPGDDLNRSWALDVWCFGGARLPSSVTPRGGGMSDDSLGLRGCRRRCTEGLSIALGVFVGSLIYAVFLQAILCQSLCLNCGRPVDPAHWRQQLSARAWALGA
jgi:hypothetical protein